MLVKMNCANGGGVSEVSFLSAPNVANGNIYLNTLILPTENFKHFTSSLLSGTDSQYCKVGYLDTLPTYGSAMGSLISPVALSNADFDIETTHPYLVACGTTGNLNGATYSVTLKV